MEQAKNRLNILIFDACCNNPLPGEPKDGLKGLATMWAPPGSGVVFATDTGMLAADGWQEQLVCRGPGVTLHAAGGAGDQGHIRCTPAFYCRGVEPTSAAPVPPALDGRAAELAVWRSASKLGTVEAYQRAQDQRLNCALKGQ
jgi:hypothetical protein